MKKEKTNNFDKIEKIITKSIISLCLICLILIWSIIPVILTKIIGIDYKTLSNIIKVFLAFLNDLLLIGILIFIYRKTFFKDFKNFFNQDLGKHILYSFKYWIVGLTIMIVSNCIISIILGNQLAANEKAVRELIDTYPIYMAFQLMIYAPITEELVFRKSIKNITSNQYIYIFLSGFIFGGMHVISSLNSFIDLLYLIPYCSLGFTFAYLYHKTDNIFSTITAHAFHNTLALITYLITVISWKNY